MDEKKPNSTQVIKEIKENLQKLQKPSISRPDLLKLIREIKANIAQTANKQGKDLIVLNHGSVSLPKPGWLDLDEIEKALSQLADKEEECYDQMVEQYDKDTIVIGEAFPGADVSAGKWRIKSVESKGKLTKVRWANGDPGFVHKWTDREKLDY